MKSSSEKILGDMLRQRRGVVKSENRASRVKYYDTVIFNGHHYSLGDAVFVHGEQK